MTLRKVYPVSSVIRGSKVASSMRITFWHNQDDPYLCFVLNSAAELKRFVVKGNLSCYFVHVCVHFGYLHSSCDCMRHEQKENGDSLVTADWKSSYQHKPWQVLKQ